MIFFKNIVLFLLFIFSLNSYSQTFIKFATLAPEGTTWTKILRQYAKEVEKETENRIKFKIYSGGISGDEKDIVRKIRIGQLNSAGFTGFGIGEIASELRVLDAPLLFRNTKEIDYIYKKFNNEFSNIFLRKGFVLLGWSEIGNVYIFSEKKVNKFDELEKLKMWLWEGDPIARETFEAMNIKAIPLSITDVMTSIQTGLIDSVYATPLTIIPLQWYTKMKFAINYPITNASGAILLSKKTFDTLNDKDKKILLDLSKKYFKDLNDSSRKENEKAIETLKKKKVTFVDLNEKEKEHFLNAAKIAREKLSNNFFSKELLLKIQNALNDLRKEKK